ncbi:major facilitator superfamily protein [Kipferlia bialata]|uniref:Major facilitator superfamily protein n=1 Tax=Kipferlia bialata TaxID=797122 RepID=A0A9K3CX67_9EUKA|nr:major facilitator superfamily protein [Kipferlia bialata]|eukprot:g5424.t1
MTGWTLLMAILDMSVVNLCLYSISAEFNEPLASVQWVSDAYSIFLASMSILAGKIGDRFSMSRVFLMGLVGFVFCSFLCSRAVSLNQLVVSRVLQGIAGAFLMSNSMSLSTILCDKQDLPVILSYQSMFVSVGTSFGPVLGGFLVSAFSWRAVFTINIGIGAVAMAINLVYLPKVPVIKEPSFDFLGGIGLTLAITSLVYGITQLEVSWQFGLVLILLACAFMGLTLWHEWHSECAILPRRVLGNKSIMAALIGGLFNFAINSAVQFLIPYIYQYAFGYSTAFVGFLSAFPPIAMFCYSYVNGYLLQRVCTWALRVVGIVLTVLSCLLLAWSIPYAADTAGVWICVVANVLLGLAMTAFIGGNNTHMMTSAPIDVKGVMGGCIQTFRETGFALGISLSCLVRDTLQSKMWPYPVPNPNNPIPAQFTPIYVEVMQLVVVFLISFTVVIAVCTGTV